MLANKPNNDMLRPFKKKVAYLILQLRVLHERTKEQQIQNKQKIYIFDIDGFAMQESGIEILGVPVM